MTNRGPTWRRWRRRVLRFRVEQRRAGSVRPPRGAPRAESAFDLRPVNPELVRRGHHEAPAPRSGFGTGESRRDHDGFIRGREGRPMRVTQAEVDGRAGRRPATARRYRPAVQARRAARLETRSGRFSSCDRHEQRIRAARHLRGHSRTPPPRDAYSPARCDRSICCQLAETCTGIGARVGSARRSRSPEEPVSAVKSNAHLTRPGSVAEPWCTVGSASAREVVDCNDRGRYGVDRDPSPR